MSQINGKKFDPSFICTAFSNNNKLLLDMIADEFGLTRDQLVEKLLNCGADEKARVKQMIKEDERRAKRLKKVEKRKSIQLNQSEEVEEVVVVSTIKSQQEQLIADLATALQKKNKVDEELVALELASQTSEQQLDKIRQQVDSQKQRIIELRATLNDAEEELASTRKDLISHEGQHVTILQQLEDARNKVKQAGEELEFIQLQLDEINSHIVYLISPTYKGELPTEPGQLISNVQINGVKTEEAQSDMDDMSFSDMMKLSRITGLGDIIQLGQAYEFACLVSRFIFNPNLEVHVINDDEHIKKLLDWMIEK